MPKYDFILLSRGSITLVCRKAIWEASAIVFGDSDCGINEFILMNCGKNGVGTKPLLKPFVSPETNDVDKYPQ